jgi:large conductance mechanosensitive channel
MWEDFKQFITSRNVLDWAVGVVIGTAFGKIIDSLVNDIITPPIGLLLGKVDFRDLFIDLSGRHFTSLPQAQAAGAATINYGAFINTVINFLLVSLIVYLLVRELNRLVQGTQTSRDTKTCPFCVSNIPANAVRCPYCTSLLDGSVKHNPSEGTGQRPMVVVTSQSDARSTRNIAKADAVRTHSERTTIWR